ncbi:hypothetical protein DXG01_010638 [Tephrocybe rancida]|nr:hypothetical protein DXG01_010638 [Tephrocybe rancida]
MKWIEFYSTSIKNCQVAALNLPEYPHQERESMLQIAITHKKDSTLPIEMRFTIGGISRISRNDPGGAVLDILFNHPDIRQASEFGKKEMGRDYYGTTIFLIMAEFSPSVMRMRPKCFSINKTTARAKVISGPWWPPLRYMMENGKRMRFCCGKIEGVGCCCGGWVHEENAKKGDVWRA